MAGQTNNRFDRWATPGVRGLQPYQPGKPIDELQREYGIDEVIKLASNENPLGPSPVVAETLAASVAELSRYPDGNGFALKQALAAHHRLNSAQITLGNGSSDVLEFVVRAFVQPGDEVLFAEYAFAMYPLVTLAAGGTPVAAPARDWGHDPEAMLAAITPRTKVVFVANPNNPTGTWLSDDELQAFLEAVPEHIVVAVDEAYFDYASDPALGAPDYPDASRWLSRYPNLMVTRTFSKVYGLAGLRVGYALSHPDLADLLNRVRPPFNVNSQALAAAEAALADQAHVSRSVILNVEEMARVTDGVTEMGLEFIPSVGNFVSVEVGDSAAAVYDALLREGVIVRPLANYGMPRHLRVTLGLPAENERFLGALRRALKA